MESKERFVKEYANNKIKRTLAVIGMSDESKDDVVRKINNVVKNRERRLITVDEAMLSICRA